MATAAAAGALRGPYPGRRSSASSAAFGGVALPPLRVIQIQSQSRRPILWNFTFTQPADGAAAAATDELPSAPEKREQPKENENITEAARIMHLYNAWATLLNTDRDEVTKSSDGIFNKGSDVPRPPHLELHTDCRKQPKPRHFSV